MVSSIGQHVSAYNINEQPIVDRVRTAKSSSAEPEQPIIDRVRVRQNPTSADVGALGGAKGVRTVDTIDENIEAAAIDNGPCSHLTAAFKKESNLLIGKKIGFWDKFLDTLKEIFTLSFAKTRTYDGIIPDSGIWQGKAAQLVAAHGPEFYSEFVCAEKSVVVGALKKELKACNPRMSDKEISNTADLLYKKMGIMLVDQYQADSFKELLTDPNYSQEDIAVFSQLADCAAFQDMGPDEATSLMYFIGSQDPFIGEPAREALAKIIFSDEFVSGDYNIQEALLKRFTQNYPEEPASLSSLGTLFEIKRQETTVSGPEKIGGRLHYQVGLNGQQLEVIMPEKAIAWQPTIEEIARAVGSLPKVAFVQLTTIEVAAEGVAGEPHGAESKGNTITLYPQEGRAVEDLDLALNHHVGRLLAEAKFTDNELDLNWTNYRTCCTMDIFGISSESKTDVMSDFGEAFVLYSALNGTEYYNSVSQLFRNRFSQVLNLVIRAERAGKVV